MASTISHSEPGCGACDKLKYTSSYMRRNHWRQVHQKTCLLKWAGGAEHSSLTRAHDGKWYCPQCHASFGGGPQAIQKHVAHGACQETRKKAAVSKPVQYVGDPTRIVRGPGVNKGRKKGSQPVKDEDNADNQIVEMK
ncbi:hypothetical protein PHLGIDRAFT_156938 [Phlebiopsis gigantea 11061_1 CR5-6]|uniref:Uncharacterized protein n=1 Tax=Phlebiopsis gigantea (strain 11061_1 CR5-6) TaxID=745531 RepID=A0A0C3P070_PHLG1|nr:hypothetical protein PHLGIDRAFT_156938 [Phlebiopsis gigantea 11061_1 CR5-6]